MKKNLILISLFILTFLAGYFLKNIFTARSNKVMTVAEKIIPKPLEVYTIESLSNTTFESGKIDILETADEQDNYTSYKFKFLFKPNPTKNDTKTTTGQINIPSGNKLSSNNFPIVLMIRGYVDQELYQTGDGTRSAAIYFAENGFITIAPDFLGYADSDSEAANIFESRFQTYTTVLSLIESLDQIDNWDKKNIFIWAHSNGGQIALTILEITGKDIPTTLWTPVSKPFPYSILYYTDESEDRGKLIRRELAKFEDLYDTDKYSLTEYFDRINAPIQIHQGTADDAVPVEWSSELYAKLLDLDLEINYFKYPGADHNLRPSWDTVVQRDLKFFQKYLITR